MLGFENILFPYFKHIHQELIKIYIFSWFLRKYIFCYSKLNKDINYRNR